MNKIENMSYVQVVSDRKLKGSGLSRGNLLLVTGTKMVPASRQDPYLMREIVVAIVVTPEGEHLMPAQGNEYQAYLIDPRSLQTVTEDFAAFLKQKLILQYAGL